MLYLFNSAYRPLYTVNVLNTLYLPEGHTNEYRYRHTGAPRYVSPAMFESLAKRRRGGECVIVFIDRFAAEGYAYYPLRFGKFVGFRNVNEYTHFNIQLGEFVYPTDVSASVKRLGQVLGARGLPKLTDGKPENPADGDYAIDGDSIFGQDRDFIRGEAAWNAAIEGLSATHAFRTDETQQPVFIRTDVTRPDAAKVESPKFNKNSSSYHLAKKTSYQMILTYRYPRQRLDPTASARVSVGVGDNLVLLGNSALDINTHANSVVVGFISKKYPEDTSGVITLSPDTTNAPALLLPTTPIQYKFAEPGMFWLQLLCAFVLLSILNSFLALDVSKITPLTAGSLLSAMWPRALLGLPQVATLFWLFWLIGKKVL